MRHIWQSSGRLFCCIYQGSIWNYIIYIYFMALDSINFPRFRVIKSMHILHCIETQHFCPPSQISEFNTYICYFLMYIQISFIWNRKALCKLNIKHEKNYWITFKVFNAQSILSITEIQVCIILKYVFTLKLSLQVFESWKQNTKTHC